MSGHYMRNGMMGTEEVDTLNSIPSAQFGTAERIKPPEYKSEPIAPKLMPNNMDYSTRRQVLPCVGITHHVLRSEPVPANHGMVAPTGIGRHQPRGLAQEKPTDLPIMKFSNPFASGFDNPLGAPN